MQRFVLCLLVLILAAAPVWAARNPIQPINKSPYVSALVIDADTGNVLFEDNADARVYPASVLKLMDLYVLLDRIDQGLLKLDEMVPVTAEAYKTGGSQVYLDPKEQFTVEELLYALMVQSANDAAVALATHVAGFDLRADDTPVYTNGYDVVALEGERHVKLARRDLVEAVALL